MYYTLVPSPSPTPTPVSASHQHHYHTQHQPSPSLPPSSLSSSSSSPVSCSTLFVANLELHHTEDEVANLFGNCAGFVRAKLFTRGGPPVAFVEFKNVECASSAMEKIQGYILPNSKRVNGLRIEYARQKMGEQFRSPTTAEAVSVATVSAITSSPSASPPIQNIYSSQHYQQQRQMALSNGGHISSNSSSCSSSTSELQHHHQNQQQVAQPAPQVWALHSGSPVPMPYHHGNGYGTQPQMLTVNGYPNQYISPWPLKYN
ncbi:Cell wall integrity protein scw1 [Geodia barretti]|uniref:Cell wall integrity protein scw1 n=1 Tax=Geodia barretti TaxID=519541 RepID=A0AA35SMV8_GEOBA|nr:Cell wall integrity protein scw1 [Geodia barretti]